MKKAMLTKWSTEHQVADDKMVTDSSYSSFEEYISGSGMVEQAVASDGHCILHSVSEALEWETGIARSIDHMFQLVVLEVCDHAEYYQDFSPHNKNVVDEVIQWSMDRKYDRDSVDLVLNILCNALSIAITVVEEGRVQHSERVVVIELRQVPGREGAHSSSMITLIKRGDHYNFLSKVSRHVQEWKMTNGRKRLRDCSPTSAAVKICSQNRYAVLESSDEELCMPISPLQRTPKRKRSGIAEHTDFKDVIIVDRSTSEGSDVPDIPALPEVITPEMRNEQDCTFESDDDQDVIIITSDSDSISVGNFTLSDSEYDEPPQKYFCHGKYWHNRKDLPIYKRERKEPFPMKDVVHLLLTARAREIPLCTDRPTCPRQDVIFLIDTRHVRREDLISDGNGVYSKELRHYRWVIGLQDGDIVRKRTPLPGYTLRTGEYFLHWHTYSIPEHGLRRQINWLCDEEGNTHQDVAFVQYTLPQGVTSVDFIPKHHGNAKLNIKPFVGRLAKSVREELGVLTKVQKPGATLRHFEGKDPYAAKPQDQPSLSSVYNCRSKGKHQDPLQEMLDFAEEYPGPLIIGQHGVPGITLVLQTEYMRNNSRFITDDTVLQTDTTFGNHDFYVTTVTLQDKALVSNKRNREHPWVMLAVAFHEKKEARVHALIVQDIVHSTPVLQKMKRKVTVVTDDETALWKAWKPYAHLLRCSNHLRRNFKDYLLRDLRMSRENTVPFTDAVFKPGGLVDSEDFGEFNVKLGRLKPDFDHWEMVALSQPPGYCSKAAKWLEKHGKNIAKRLLKSARRKAGFPVDQRPYTNGAEGFNCRLQESQKETVQQARKLTFVQYFSRIILKIQKHMQACLTKAIIGTGDFQVSETYAYLSIPMNVWVSWSEPEKQGYISEVGAVSLTAAGKKKKIVSPSQAQNVRELACHDIALPQKVANTLLSQGITPEIVGIVVSGAESILNQPGTFTTKPGTQGEYMVASSRTHQLYNCKRNKDNITCDCKGYRSKLCCKHSLAIAEHCGILARHLSWLQRQPGSRSRGTKTVLLTKRTAGTGKKGGRPKYCSHPQRRQGTRREQLSTTNSDYNPAFTKCYHNNNPFIIIQRKMVRRDRYKCYHCNLPFEAVVPPPPNNLAIWHRGQWEYKDKNDPGSELRVSKQLTDYYYHPTRECIRGRYPYFLPAMLQIHEGLALTLAQRDILWEELSFKPHNN